MSCLYNNERIFYIHIPKCAGMTLHAGIEQQYEPDEIYTVPSVSWNEQNLVALHTEWEPERKARLRIVKGHMKFGWHMAFDNDPFTYITLLRDPVERIISLYNYIGPGHFQWEEKQKCGDAADFADLHPEEMSKQVDMIAGPVMRCESWGEEEYQEHKMQQALSNLTHKFSYVGFVHLFDVAWAEMCEIFGWDWNGSLPRKNEGDVPMWRRASNFSLYDAIFMAHSDSPDMHLYYWALDYFKAGFTWTTS
jgi:hypothetical protein